MLCFGVGSVEGELQQDCNSGLTHFQIKKNNNNSNLDFLNIFISYWAFSSPSGPDLYSDPMLKTTKQIIF